MSSMIHRLNKLPEDNTDWLWSFGDVLALLLAFFILILSTSSPDVGKLEQLMESWAAITNGTPPPTPFTDIKEGFDQLVESQNLQESVDITMDHDGVILEFRGVSLFEPGKAKLSYDAAETLTKASKVILQHSRAHYSIEVEGHTDDVPIHNMKFVSNWELSSARSTGVVRHLISKGIDPLKLKGSSYADTRPKVDISKAVEIDKAREENRRIVIYVHR